LFIIPTVPSLYQVIFQMKKAREAELARTNTELYASQALQRSTQEQQALLEQSQIQLSKLQLEQEQEMEEWKHSSSLSVFTPLTKEEEEQIANNITLGDADSVVVDHFNLMVSRQDLRSLLSRDWLNDEVNLQYNKKRDLDLTDISLSQIINFYLALIEHRSVNEYPCKSKLFCFNSFFYLMLAKGYYKVRRWTKKVTYEWINAHYGNLATTYHILG